MREAPRREHLRESPLLLALYLLIYLSVLVRLLLRPQSEGVVGTTAYGLMAAFLVLGVIQVPLSRRWRAWTHIHLVAQCLIVLGLFLTEPTIDYYGILFIGLSIVAGRDLEPPWDAVWIGILCFGVVVGLILAFGARDAVSYMPIYVAACLLVALFGRSTRRAEEARERSESMRTELEEAYARLRAYAGQAEKVAAAQERARLSRELHDAATQTVFSMHLTTEAARMALTDDPARLPSLLDRIQQLAQEALAELRSLVHELRPLAATEESLAGALERHAAARERRNGLRVALTVRGEERCTGAAREALLGAAVEALNNVVKHAGVAEAQVDLSFDEHGALLRVSDAGAGFDPKAARSAESVGLVSIRERAEALGGALTVQSVPGRGTTVEVRVPRPQEDHAP